VIESPNLKRLSCLSIYSLIKAVAEMKYVCLKSISRFATPTEKTPISMAQIIKIAMIPFFDVMAREYVS